MRSEDARPFTIAACTQYRSDISTLTPTPDEYPPTEDLHLPKPRQHCSRDDARDRGSVKAILFGTDECRRPGVPRGIFGHCRAVPSTFPFQTLWSAKLSANEATCNSRRCSSNSRSSSVFATGCGKSLRSALGDPTTLEGASEAHDRGAILVAAVFDGFFQIYRTRIRDLVRSKHRLTQGRL